MLYEWEVKFTMRTTKEAAMQYRVYTVVAPTRSKAVRETYLYARRLLQAYHLFYSRKQARNVVHVYHSHMLKEVPS